MKAGPEVLTIMDISFNKEIFSTIIHKSFTTVQSNQ